MSGSILLAILALLPVSDTNPDILFSNHQVLGRDIDTVEIWLQERSQDGKTAQPQYVLRRTVSYQLRLELPPKWQAQRTILWASDATCPQALEIVERLEKLQLPAIRITELPSEELYGDTVRADGTRYRLVIPARYSSEPGQIDISFGVDTPVAEWVDDSFRTLAPCWQATRPESAE